MSNRYSLGGYRIAIQARSSRTLLVEGKEDKDLFDTLRLCRFDSIDVVIDTNEILDDPALSGLGAKDRIKHFANSCNSGSPVAQKINCLVDREWDGLVDAQSNDSIIWSAPVVNKVMLETSGHSIENTVSTLILSVSISGILDLPSLVAISSME